MKVQSLLLVSLMALSSIQAKANDKEIEEGLSEEKAKALAQIILGAGMIYGGLKITDWEARTAGELIGIGGRDLGLLNDLKKVSDLEAHKRRVEALVTSEEKEVKIESIKKEINQLTEDAKKIHPSDHAALASSKAALDNATIKLKEVEAIKISVNASSKKSMLNMANLALKSNKSGLALTRGLAIVKVGAGVLVAVELLSRFVVGLVQVTTDEEPLNTAWTVFVPGSLFFKNPLVDLEQ